MRLKVLGYGQIENKASLRYSFWSSEFARCQSLRYNNYSSFIAF